MISELIESANFNAYINALLETWEKSVGNKIFFMRRKLTINQC